MIAAVILAAGGSSRFGSPKQLIELNSENIVARAVRVAAEAGCDPVIVIAGAAADKLPSLESARTIVNEEWMSGQSTSLRLGIRHAREAGANAAVVMLSDQPLIDAQMLRSLIESFSQGHPIVAASYNDTIGVPAIFSEEYFEELCSLHGDRGAGNWLRQRAEVVAIRMPAAESDVDTPQDLERIRQA